MLRTTILLGIVLALAACVPAASPEGEVLMLEVGPQTVECRGEAPARCLRVRRTPGEEWTNFYDSIEGFEHVAGYQYVLEVVRRRVTNPPADGSAFTWRLLRVVSKTPA